jgi:virginiamycin A acetyltransferase
VRETIKALARAVATVAASPLILSFYVRAALMGRNQALLASTQTLAIVPGLLGQYLRRAFLTHAIAHCAPTAVIEWGTLIADVGTRIGDHTYIGPCCHIGLADIGRDVLIAPCVHIPSGRHTHAIDDPDTALRNQIRQATMVHIGANSWIGSGAVVMADVGQAATRPIQGYSVAAGSPARVIRARESQRDTHS